MIIGTVTTIVAALSAISMFADVPDKVDPWVHTEAEAAEEHEAIVVAEEMAQQTQAGFNAYTLKAIMEQEIAILELQIEAEEDEDEKEILEAELRSKRALIRQLEAEERKQLLKGSSG